MEKYKKENQPENTQNLEKFEKQKYEEYEAAMVEEDQIWKEIENVFATTENRDEAEKIILEKFASKYDEARNKTNEAYAAWWAELEKSQQL